MKHLLAIEGLDRPFVERLLDRAREFREGRVRERPLAGQVVANLFFEPSTRTRTSFELAAAFLGAHVLNWTVAGSSASKGESLLDTVRNLAAMGPRVLVLRHGGSGAAALAAAAQKTCSVVNAGDGQHEHPSQALLDAFTLRERWGSLDGRKVTIVGDVLHSRVARSNVHCLRLLGAKVQLCGPATLVPDELAALGVPLLRDLDRALDGADAVMLLRLQRERMAEALFPTEAEYHARWGLTAGRAAQLPRHALVLHPGPVNRGLEIAPEVADGSASVILEQVENGVAVRKAILEWLQ
ncbi:MAG: aspartate carbamoyltransferase catalytic subunit [Myxococcaceae bacterium]|nr:aspartate carbamoyltransferase catalytic subunit [Myxococcaceae bacterium]